MYLDVITAALTIFVLSDTLGGVWVTCICLTARETGEVLERLPLGPAGDNTTHDYLTQLLVQLALSRYL